MGVSVSQQKKPKREGFSQTKHNLDLQQTAESGPSIQVKPVSQYRSNPVTRQQINHVAESNTTSTARQLPNNVSKQPSDFSDGGKVQRTSQKERPNPNQGTAYVQSPAICQASTQGLGQQSALSTRYATQPAMKAAGPLKNSAEEQRIANLVMVQETNPIPQGHAHQGAENKEAPVLSRPSTAGVGRQARSLTRCKSAQSHRLRSRSIPREQTDSGVKTNTKTIQVTPGQEDMGVKPQYVKNRSKSEAKRPEKSISRQTPCLSSSQSNPDSKTETKSVQHESRQINRRKSFSAVKSIGKWNAENQSDSVAKDKSSFLPAKGLYESVARKQSHPNPRQKLKAGGAKNQPKIIKRSKSTRTINELEKPSSERWAVQRSKSVSPTFSQSKPDPDVKKVKNQGAKKLSSVPHEQLKDQAVINLPAVVTNEGSEKSTEEKDSVIPSLPPVVNKSDHTTQIHDTNATKNSSFNPNKVTNTSVCKEKDHKPTTSIPPVILAKPTRRHPRTAGPSSHSNRVSNQKLLS